MSPLSILLLLSAIFGVLQARPLTKSKLLEYKQKFATFDEDGDGQITVQETFDLAVKNGRRNPSTKAIEADMARLDEDESGTLSVIEFLKAQDVELKEALSEDKVKAYKQAFSDIDKDGDGQIALNEMATALRKESLSQDQIMSLIHTFDVDDSDTMDISEFILGDIDQHPIVVELAKDHLAERFSAIDKDKDGIVTINELEEVMSSEDDEFTEDKLHDMFIELDVDGNQKVNFEEFSTVVRQRLEKQRLEKERQMDEELKELLSVDDEELKDYKALFSYVDKDNDGQIWHNELSEVMRAHDESVRPSTIMRTADLDASGTIDMIEFRKVFELGLKFVGLRGQFIQYDENGDGIITAEDLRQNHLNNYHEEISEEEAENQINVADSDGDQKISYEEFLQVAS